MRGLSALAFVAALAFASAAQAQDVRFSVTPYIWLPTFEGDFRFNVPPTDPTGPELNPDFKIGPVDYLDNLSGAFMIGGDFSYGRIGAFTDLIYIDFSDEDASVTAINGPGPIGVPFNVAKTGDLTAWLWTIAGDYEVLSDQNYNLRAFAGARYLSIDAQVEWALAGPIGQFPQSGSASRDADNWDFIVGGRGEFRAGDHWFFPYYADIGAGDSDLTWQASLGVGYRWGWGDLRLDYRYLDYDQGDNELVQGMTLDGPSLGATFRF